MICPELAGDLEAGSTGAWMVAQRENCLVTSFHIIWLLLTSLRPSSLNNGILYTCPGHSHWRQTSSMAICGFLESMRGGHAGATVSRDNSVTYVLLSEVVLQAPLLYFLLGASAGTLIIQSRLCGRI